MSRGSVLQSGFFAPMVCPQWQAGREEPQGSPVLPRYANSRFGLPPSIGVESGGDKTATGKHIMTTITQGASAPTIFNFRSTEVRTLVLDGEVWFVASDVAKALGYPEAKDMTRMLDEDEAGRHIVPTVTTNQHGATSEQDNTVIIISESGLYHAVLKSRKPEAKPFRKWVTSEVLPAIRKNGQYAAAPQPVAADPNDPAYRSAWMASAVFCASIQIDLSRHFMAGGEHAAFRSRYLLTIDGDKPTILPVEHDACVFPWRDAPRILRDPATMMKTSLLAEIATAAAQRIAERAAYQERQSGSMQAKTSKIRSR